jgi:hypothetical protein
MPLLDHFQSFVAASCPWQSVFSAWTTRLADLLNERWLSSEFLALEFPPGADSVGEDVGDVADEPAVATEKGAAWPPPGAAFPVPAVCHDGYQVRVFQEMGGRTLVGVVELITPGNKTAASRRAFAIRCADYLYRGVSLVLLDLVTDRPGNMHNEIMRFMGKSEQFHIASETPLYAVAYRPVLRKDRAEIDLWIESCSLGQPLPTMPLRLTGDTFVAIEFEATYQETCRRRRICG